MPWFDEGLAYPTTPLTAPYVQLWTVTSTSISTMGWNPVADTAASWTTTSTWAWRVDSWTMQSGWPMLISNGVPPPQPVLVETPDEVLVRRAARAAAFDRAEELLLSLCSADQRATYRAEGWIDGLTNKGTPYRIQCRMGISGNVELFRGDHWVCLCAHPPASLPLADILLGQKLALETDEDYFVSTANVHGRRAA